MYVGLARTIVHISRGHLSVKKCRVVGWNFRSCPPSELVGQIRHIEEGRCAVPSLLLELHNYPSRIAQNHPSSILAN